MTGFKPWVAGVGVLSALMAGPAMARTSHTAHRTHAVQTHACCLAPARTEVEVELAAPVSTRTQKTGDTFALRLATPLVVDDRILLPAGTPGVGAVIEAARPGLGGKAAKLVLTARYLQVDGRRVPLTGLQLARAGRSNSMQASAVGLTGIVFAPLGFIGLAVRGGNVDLPEGVRASARLASDVVLPSQGPAPLSAHQTEAATDGDTDIHGSIEVPPPPRGKGQVVFFRAKSLLALGQWFKVREDGQAICKLTNGVYCIHVTEPGTHTYTAKFEPELKDHLTLPIGAGETYYVEGETSRALLVGAADLYPSDKQRFDLASKKLKPAAPVSADDKDEVPDEKAGAKPADSKP